MTRNWILLVDVILQQKMHFSVSSKTYGQGHVVVIMIIKTAFLITLLMHLLIDTCKIIIGV